MKLKGRHRPVQNRKVAVVPTGIMYRGCAVALMVPKLVDPIDAVASYRVGYNLLVKKAKETSVRDMYLLQVEAAKQLQGQIDG